MMLLLISLNWLLHFLTAQNTLWTMDFQLQGQRELGSGLSVILQIITSYLISLGLNFSICEITMTTLLFFMATKWDNTYKIYSLINA